MRSHPFGGCSPRHCWPTNRSGWSRPRKPGGRRCPCAPGRWCRCGASRGSSSAGTPSAATCCGDSECPLCIPTCRTGTRGRRSTSCARGSPTRKPIYWCCPTSRTSSPTRTDRRRSPVCRTCSSRVAISRGTARRWSTRIASSRRRWQRSSVGADLARGMRRTSGNFVANTCAELPGRSSMSAVTYFEAIVVGALQGVSELFPVSSVGHSVLLPAWIGGSWARDLSLGEGSPYLAVLVAMHVATALALVLFFWRDWVRLVRGLVTSIRDRSITQPDQRLAWLLVLGTIPVGIAGLLLDKVVQNHLGKPI